MDKIHLIYKLYQQGHITKNRFDELQNLSDTKRLKTLSYMLLGLGISLLITGLLFFIAANWMLIPSWAKLAGIEALLVLCLYTTYHYKDSSRLFHLLILVSSLLVGLNLVVFGQVYQTGADAYTLFATWTLLITFWALFLKNSYLFILWQGLLYLSIILYFNQYLFAFDLASKKSFYFTFITVSNLFLALSLWKKELRIFKHPLNKALLLIMPLITILIPSIDTLFSHYDKTSIFIAILLFQSSLFFLFYHNQKSILEVTLILLNFLIFIEAVLIKSFSSWYSIETLLIFGLITIGLTLGLGKLVKQLYRIYQGELV